MPMLSLGDTWLRDVDAYLSAVEGVDEFGEDVYKRQPLKLLLVRQHHFQE